MKLKGLIGFLILSTLMMGTSPYLEYEEIFTRNLNLKDRVKALTLLIKKHPYFYHPYLSLASILAYDGGNVKFPYFPENSFQNKYLKFLYYKAIENSRYKFYLSRINKLEAFNPFIIYSLAESGWNPGEKCKGCDKDLIQFINQSVNKLPQLELTLKLYEKYKNARDAELRLFFFYWAADVLLINRKPEEALKIIEKYKNTRKIAFDEYLLYYLYQFYSAVEKNPKKRLKYALKAREAAKKYHFTRFYYLFHRMAGVAYGKLGEFDKALNCFDEAIRFYRRYKKVQGMEETFTARGFLYYENGLYENARKDFEEVIKLTENKPSYRRAYAISLLALIEGKLGHYRRAEELAKKGIEESQRMRFPIAFYSSKLALAKAKIALGEVDRAIGILETMFEKGKISRDKGVMFSALSGLIEANEKKGDYGKVEYYAKEALKISRSPRDIMKYSYKIYKAMELDPSRRFPFGDIYFAIAGYPYIKRAHSIASTMKVDKLPSREERYRFLKSKFNIFSDYARATQRLIYVSLFLVVLLISIIYFGLAVIRGIRKRKASLIGPYRVEEKIGGGGMGVVYKARDLKTGEKIALKVLERQISRAEAVNKFIEEGKILRKLNHSNVVRFIESGEHEGILYIAMEYLEGKNLDELSRDSDDFPFELGINLKIAEEVLKALSYIHSQSVIHRDVKPSNIMVLGGERTLKGEIGEGTIKLMDFGIAKQIEMEIFTTTGDIFGTPYYVPPEMLKEGKMDHRGDIYSFGVTLYWMFTGKVPFYHPNISRIIFQILNEYPERPSKFSYVPECVEEIIMKCIKKEKEERYQSAEEVLEAIKACKIEVKS